MTGRPTKYRSEYAKQGKKLAQMGATDLVMADFFEVDVRTLYRWKAEHPAFCQALKVGKKVADDRVEESLWRRATGYVHDDVHITTFEGEVTQTPILKHYPPDPTSMIFWLKNRRPAEWRDKIEHTGDGGGPLRLEVVRFGNGPAPE